MRDATPRLRTAALLALLAVLAACAGPPRDASTGPRTLGAGEFPMSGKPAPTRIAIRSTLFDISDRTLGEIADAVNPLADNPETPADVRIGVLRIQLRMSTSAVAIATTPGVEKAVVDLYCYLRICRAKIDQWIADDAPDGPELAPLDEAIRDPCRMSRELLEATATREQVAFVDEAVERFLRDHRPSLPGLLVHIEDFADLRSLSERIPRSGGGLFDTVDETREEIRSTRESAEVVAFLIQRLPLLARINARLLFEEAIEGTGIDRIASVFGALSGRVEELAARVGTGAATIERLETRVGEALDALEGPDGALASTLAEARATIVEGQKLREGLDTTLPALGETLGSAREALGSLREAIAGVEELRAALADDGVTLDPGAARETAASLAAAAADLKVALSEARGVLSSDDASARLEEIVAASRTATDYVFWRAGLLLLIAACLAIVLRVAFVLTGRKGTS